MNLIDTAREMQSMDPQMEASLMDMVTMFIETTGRVAVGAKIVNGNVVLRMASSKDADAIASFCRRGQVRAQTAGAYVAVVLE